MSVHLYYNYYYNYIYIYGTVSAKISYVLYHYKDNSVVTFESLYLPNGKRY